MKTALIKYEPPAMPTRNGGFMMGFKHGILCLIMVILPSVAAAESVFTSSADEQVGVEVTVYYNNLGLVKDTRKLELSKGQGELRFMDVASHIMPVTVHAKSVNHPNEFSVLEQNYEYDLISAAKLLDKYVGKKIKIMAWNQYQDRKEVVEATLLSNNQGPVYKINDEIHLGHPGYQILPKLPENLIAKPTLTWLFDNTSAKLHNPRSIVLDTESELEGRLRGGCRQRRQGSGHFRVGHS
jgi:hypothetical protein